MSRVLVDLSRIVRGRIACFVVAVEETEMRKKWWPVVGA